MQTPVPSLSPFTFRSGWFIYLAITERDDSHLIGGYGMNEKTMSGVQILKSQPTKRKALTLAMMVALAVPAAWSGTASAQSVNNLFTSENVGRAVGATAGALLGSQIGGGNGKLAAVAVGTLAGYWAGGKIGRSMGGSQSPYYSSPATSSWSPPPPQSYAAPVSYSAPKRSPLQTAPQLDYIDAEYEARTNANVRGGPSTEYVIVEDLHRGENVRVVGKVVDRDWYMVSFNDDRAGYVYGPLLNPVRGYQTAALNYSDEVLVPTKLHRSEWDVAGLNLGMTPEEAGAAIRRSFGGEPTYNPSSGLMTYSAGGCPTAYDGELHSATPEVGWKCLQARFSGYPQARLNGFKLVQVTDHDSSREVKDLLVNRFGPVAASWKGASANWMEMTDKTNLAWGDVVGTTPVAGAAPRANYELEAAVRSIDGMTVTRMTRQAQGSVYPGGPAGSLQAGLGSDLQL